MMISGYTSPPSESIYGIISTNPDGPLIGSISGNSKLTGRISVSVKDVPYYETSNDRGGITVYIGMEVVDNGL